MIDFFLPTSTQSPVLYSVGHFADASNSNKVYSHIETRYPEKRWFDGSGSSNIAIVVSRTMNAIVLTVARGSLNAARARRRTREATAA